MMIRYLYSQLASYLYLIILLFLVEGIGRVAILFKARPHLPKRNLFCFSDTRAHLHFNTSVSKMMKNAFYFIFETSLFSRYFDFFLDFWGTCRKSRLINQKDKFNFKIYDATPQHSLLVKKNYNTDIVQYLLELKATK